MLSGSLGQDPGTPTYMEVLSGREDCSCEALRIATEEDLVVRERVPIRTERPSVREHYSLKYWSHYPDTPKYMKALSGEHADE